MLIYVLSLIYILYIYNDGTKEKYLNFISEMGYFYMHKWVHIITELLINSKFLFINYYSYYNYYFNSQTTIDHITPIILKSYITDHYTILLIINK